MKAACVLGLSAVMLVTTWSARAMEDSEFYVEREATYSVIEYEFDGIEGWLRIASLYRLDDVSRDEVLNGIFFACSKGRIGIGMVPSYTLWEGQAGAFLDEEIGFVFIGDAPLTGRWSDGVFSAMIVRGKSSALDEVTFNEEYFFNALTSAYENYNGPLVVKMLFPKGTEPVRAGQYIVKDFTDDSGDTLLSGKEVRSRIGSFHQLCSIWWSPEN